MKSFDFLKENIVDDAATMHQDHEVQMARKECYHAAEHAIAIHQLLRTVSESTGLEGWVSSKITLANDYLNTVREHLEYNLLQDNSENLTNKLDAIALAESKKCNHTAEGKECPVHGLKECGTMYRESKSAKPDYLDFDKDGNKKESMKSALKSKKKLATKQDLAEMDKSSPQPGKDGRVSHKTYGSRGDEDPGTGPEKVVKPAKSNAVTKAAEKTLTMALDQAHKKKGVAEGNLKETSAGSVAGVVNPPARGKKRSQVGTLFGGTYKQSVKETEFAGENTTPPQRPGDQVRGQERAVKKGNKPPFYHRLVGNE